MISTQCELVRVEIPTGKASHNRSDGSLEPKFTKTSEEHSDIVDLSNDGLWQQQQHQHQHNNNNNNNNNNKQQQQQTTTTTTSAHPYGY